MLPLGTSTTLANWQDPPFNRWGLPARRPDPADRPDSRGTGRRTAPFTARTGPSSSARWTDSPGTIGTVAGILHETETDAFLVLHRRRAGSRELRADNDRHSRHLLMSVTKSFIGAIAGILAERGDLDLDGPITEPCPRSLGFGYDGATVRHLLDMRSGVLPSPRPTWNPDSEIRFWSTLPVGARPTPSLPTSTYEYLSRLPADRPHGGGFNYRSCETDMLGWVL